MQRALTIILTLIAVIYTTAFYSTRYVTARYCGDKDGYYRDCDDDDKRGIQCSVSEYETLVKSASFNQKVDLIDSHKYHVFGSRIKEEYTS